MEDILKELIHLFFEYNDSKSSRNLSLEEFIGYLNTALNKDEGNESSQAKSEFFKNSTDDLGIQLVLLNRYAKEYVKKALKGTPLTTSDEFPFLISLLATDSHTKSELISKMMLTKTSGTEVIKRLVKKGLIDEFEDPNDKRSIRIKLTESGKRLTLNMLPKMQMVSKIITGKLTRSELHTLNYLLKKLEVHHKKVYQEQGSADLEEILRL